MAQLPTVEIVNPSNPDDYIVINESDYDPDAHELWEKADQTIGGDPLLDLTVSDLEDALQDVDDEERIEALLIAEDRTTARRALEARLDEVQGEGG